MYHLTRYEQETVVNYNNEEQTVRIFTYDRKLIRKLKKYHKEHPEYCKAIYETDKGPCEYEVLKKKMSITFRGDRPPMSDERKQQCAERLKKFHKNKK